MTTPAPSTPQKAAPASAQRRAKQKRAERITSWRVRIALIVMTALAIGVVSVTNRLLTDRFTENTRNRAELRLVLYSGNLLSELRQNAIVPQLLSRDPSLISALNSANYSQSTQRLISFVDEIGAASLTLLDKDGRTVAATDRNRLGESHRAAPYYVDALRAKDTIFTLLQNDTGRFEFVYSRRMESQGNLIGVILVAVDLHKYERAWAGISDAVIVSDSEGQIILSTEPRWRGLTEAEALTREPVSSALQRALQATADWTTLPPDAYLGGEAVMRVSGRVAFRGWRIANFTTYDSVREKVNGFLALEIMGFAILLALAFYFLNRKTARRIA